MKTAACCTGSSGPMVTAGLAINGAAVTPGRLLVVPAAPQASERFWMAGLIGLLDQHVGLRTPMADRGGHPAAVCGEHWNRDRDSAARRPGLRHPLVMPGPHRRTRSTTTSGRPMTFARGPVWVVLTAAP